MLSKKTKILFVHHGTGIGGAPISLLNLIKFLNPERYIIKVTFVLESSAVEMFRQNRIETEVINAPGHWFTHTETGHIPWYQFYRYVRVFLQWQRTARSIAKNYLSAQDCDIVHLNSHALTSWAFAAHRLGLKVVLHNREAIAKGYTGLRHSILKHLVEQNCDAVINISEDNKKRLGLEKNAMVF
mgnify:CR=1 FL=1